MSLLNEIHTAGLDFGQDALLLLTLHIKLCTKTRQHIFSQGLVLLRIDNPNKAEQQREVLGADAVEDGFCQQSL